MAPARVKPAELRRMAEILRILKREYPEAKCSLSFQNPYQLLMAVILSAQCTDERINMVTPGLFKKYPTAKDMANADIRELEKMVQSTGFFRNKALSLKECSRALVEEHGVKVPSTMEELVKLRGVGRKTANVILGEIYDVPGLVVDTHVLRVSKRLGFTKSDNPVQVERDMMSVVPKEDWTNYGHLLISHGRAICTARSPRCEECPINRYCPKIGVSKKF